jgi:TRAP-type C4-dicarboxylate transport system permease small subunit
MDNLLDIENRKTSKKKSYFKLALLFGIIALNIDDIIEDKYGDFVFYYLIVLTLIGLITLAIYFFNLINRNYVNFTISILSILWLLASPFKYSHRHEHSGFMYYFQLIVGCLFFLALLYELINYKKFINKKPIFE